MDRWRDLLVAMENSQVTFSGVLYVNCLETKDTMGCVSLEIVCNGHKTMYDAIACVENPGMKAMFEFHTWAAKQSGLTARLLICKQTLEELVE